jgi:hypothetical protein
MGCANSKRAPRGHRISVSPHSDQLSSEHSGERNNGDDVTHLRPPRLAWCSSRNLISNFGERTPSSITFPLMANEKNSPVLSDEMTFHQVLNAYLEYAKKDRYDWIREHCKLFTMSFRNRVYRSMMYYARRVSEEYVLRHHDVRRYRVSDIPEYVGKILYVLGILKGHSGTRLDRFINSRFRALIGAPSAAGRFPITDGASMCTPDLTFVNHLQYLRIGLYQAVFFNIRDMQEIDFDAYDMHIRTIMRDPVQAHTATLMRMQQIYSYINGVKAELNDVHGRVNVIINEFGFAHICQRDTGEHIRVKVYGESNKTAR